jgi:hypothetical protein
LPVSGNYKLFQWQTKDLMIERKIPDKVGQTTRLEETEGEVELEARAAAAPF